MGKQWKQQRFYFFVSKITADGDCSHEMKRRLLLGRRVMTNLDSIFKSRDITLPTKVCLVKTMVFSVVTYGCESWTVEKAEHQGIDAFELCCWRRLLRVPWTARRSNQSILKEISPGCSFKDWCWSWNSDTLATWCEELTHLKRPWCWERLRAGEEGDDRGCDSWMASLTQWTWFWVDSGSWWYYLSTSFSAAPFSFCLQSFLSSGSFPLIDSASGAQSIGASASSSVLPVNIQGWFPSGLTDLISLQFKGLSRVFSNTTIQKP